MLRAVSKFGGSSVADAACVSRVVSLIKAPPADRTRQHVVVSAPGKRTLPGGAADIKVTDLLLKAHGLAAAKSRAEYDATMSTIAARFMELCPGLGSLQAGLDAAATEFLRTEALHLAGAETARRRPDSTVDRSAWGQPEGTWLVTFLNTDGAFEQALPALHAKVRAAAVAVDRAQWNLTAGVADGQLNYRVAEYHTMRSELDNGQPLPDPT